jgi:glycyl-tRNA synthetase beta chain
MVTKNLLVELLVEELPPKALKQLGESFGAEIFKELELHDFLDAGASLTTYASPRRLAAHITNVREISPEKKRRTKLMPVTVALDASGNPTPALIKKLMGLGYHNDVDFVSIIRERVTAEIDGKSEVLFHTDMASGSALQVRLESALQASLVKLPIPKVMTYQLADGWSSVNFVRPAHGLTALHGAEIVPINVLGLSAGRETQGHRFEAKSIPIILKSADSYAQQLETEGAVIASFTARRTEIAKQIAAVAAKENLKPIDDEALLDEVTALVERPNVLLGQFEKEFLEVPSECLILTMKANQKYFPLLDASGKLTNKFLIVSNIRPADASKVIGGNERVVRPRLADAKFFFDQDRKKTLESRVEGLSKVVYHNKLGTQGERVERVRAIAKAIGQQLGGDALAAQADEAAMLAKADLLTNMVGEFPELQGMMGRYYAQHDGLSDEIAYAIEDHYKPRFAGDELPRNMVGICVALADKIETLVGMFSIGQIPTGDKDPFALRRHALGIARLLIESNLDLELKRLIDIAIREFENFATTLSAQAEGDMMFGLGCQGAKLNGNDDVFNLIFERLNAGLREQGFATQQINAVFSLSPQRLNQVPKLLAAVHAFSALPEAPALAAANKRVSNILKKEESTLRQAQGERIVVNTALFKETAETALYIALSAITPKANTAFERGDYTASLQELAKLKEPVDAFFDNVMVNVEDAALRANRLALLAQLHTAMNRVADISKLAS